MHIDKKENETHERAALKPEWVYHQEPLTSYILVGWMTLRDIKSEWQVSWWSQRVRIGLSDTFTGGW